MVVFANRREVRSLADGRSVPYQAYTKAQANALRARPLFSSMATTAIRFGAAMQRFGDLLIGWGWNWGWRLSRFPENVWNLSLIRDVG